MPEHTPSQEPESDIDIPSDASVGTLRRVCILILTMGFSDMAGSPGVEKGTGQEERDVDPSVYR